MTTPILTINKADFFSRVGYNQVSDTGLQMFKPGAMLFDLPTTLVPKSEAIENDELLQLIPMAVVRFWDGSKYKYLSYRESLQIENGLTHDVYTMEFKDYVYTANTSQENSFGVIAATIVNIMMSQLDTSISADQVSMSDYITLYDPSDEDKNRLAVAFTITITNDQQQFITTTKAGIIDSLSWQHIKTIKNKDDTLVTRYDNWSQIFMDYFVEQEERPPNMIDGVTIVPMVEEEVVEQIVTPTPPTTVNMTDEPAIVDTSGFVEGT